jgi:uncharacterized membrane protein YraQ (UPF0718 family)
MSAHDSAFQLVATVFVSIALEAVPFLLMGTFLSSLIEVFIPESGFAKIIPANRFAALLLAAAIGLVFPVCECAVIPVAARLLKKGVPLHFATVFVLAVPTVNIPVIISTWYAFSGRPEIVLLRVGCSLLIALAIGLLVSLLRVPDAVLAADASGDRHGENASKPPGGTNGPAVPSCSQAHDGPYVNRGSSDNRATARKIMSVLDHTTNEFFGTGKYLLLGALVAALFQSAVPRSALAALGGNNVLSTAVMAFFAYVLSVCSQTDAFIARSFQAQFPVGAVLAFMVVGAMIDLKNTIMLARVVKKRYLAALIALVCLGGLAASVVVNAVAGR